MMVDEYVAEAKLVKERLRLCAECGTPSCAYYDEGVCRYPLVKGRKPEITEEGCLDGVVSL